MIDGSLAERPFRVISNCTDPDVYQQTFQRLVRDLKAEGASGVDIFP
jgi:hypothetical protein